MNTRVKAMLNFAYFCSNYPSDFIEEAFKNHPEKIKHLKSKFADAYASAKAVGAVTRFVHELDETNQEILLDWIDRNYTAFERSKVQSSIEGIEKGFESIRKILSLDPSTEKFKEIQGFYYDGAMLTLEYYPSLWYNSIKDGKNIFEERQKINLKKS